MATITAFENLEIWTMARELATKIHIMANRQQFKNDFTLIDQIRRSSGSVMDNIAEGYERDGNREFIYFLCVAKGSAGETRSQLYRAYDCKYITEQELKEIKDHLIHLSSKIGSMINYLKQTKYRGNKFKRVQYPKLETSNLKHIT